MAKQTNKHKRFQSLVFKVLTHLSRLHNSLSIAQALRGNMIANLVLFLIFFLFMANKDV